MHVIDILSFDLFPSWHLPPIPFILHLLPRNVAPHLSTLLDETLWLLHRAEEVGAVPLRSKYKHHFDLYADLHMPDCPSISCPDVAQQTNSQ